MIVWQGRFCRFGDIYFGEESVPRADVDVIRHFHRPTPVPGMPCSPVQTIVIDLAPDPEVLLAAVSKNTRYKIRRAAEKDDVKYEVMEATGHAVEEFIGYYAQFAALKGLPPLPSRYLHALGRVLDLSVVRWEGEVLVWHAHHRGRERVRLLHSVSLYRTTEDSSRRNLVGRANRYHHWQDLCRFRAEGIVLYDFGGWYEGAEDQEKVRINAFKEEFGGRIVPTFSCQDAITVKGRLVLALQGAAESVRSGLRVVGAAHRRMQPMRAVPQSSRDGDGGKESHAVVIQGVR